MIYIIETLEEDESTSLRRTYDSEMDGEMLEGIVHVIEEMNALVEGKMICISTSLL